MPTYAYQCNDCGNAIEVFQKMSDDPLKECGSCGGGLKKIMFPVGIVFKGSGFYVNDYAKKGSNGTKDGAAAKPDGASSAPKADAKSETPAAPAATTSTASDSGPAASKPAEAKTTTAA